MGFNIWILKHYFFGGDLESKGWSFLNPQVGSFRELMTRPVGYRPVGFTKLISEIESLHLKYF